MHIVAESGMHVSNIHKLVNLALAWLGITLFVSGFQKMSVSNYSGPEMSAGWMMGMAWIIFGGIIASSWISFMLSELIHQKIAGRARFTTSKMIAISFVLFFAAISASVGTYLTWKHPLLVGPCDCDVGFWGPNCKPCTCVHGICDSGQYGTGRCACDFGFASANCSQCDARHKPEPDSPSVKSGDSEPCDTCVTGRVGPELFENRPKCDACDVGYTGTDCDVCAPGRQPWYKKSSLFPETIAKDDGRHICDECMPNHWGYYCLACPWGNDVPKITLEKNNPIVSGTRVRDSNKNAGTISDMQVYDFPEETDEYTPLNPSKARQKIWRTSYNYNPKDENARTRVRVKIKYGNGRRLSDWILLSELEGVQCNNRGHCMDDAHRKAEIDLNTDWNKTCTYAPFFEECSTDKDCKVSENCMGQCQGLGPSDGNDGFADWQVEIGGSYCKTDSDCYQPIFKMEKGKKVYQQNYKGGACTSRGCCQETWHGTGDCACNPSFFGPLAEEDGQQENYQKSPACDFCPGYDWITENPATICSGGKGTCSKSSDRDGNYIQMRCACGPGSYIVDGVPDPDRVIEWLGDVCQCGDWNEDGKCDTCAAGHWGPECKECPGGAFLPCGGNGHGLCNGGIDGDGTCNCNINGPSHWMLAPYVKRYPSEIPGEDIHGRSDICSECAPNHYGEKCLICEDTEMIKPSELDHIFQPPGSYLFGGDPTWVQQSSLAPTTVCHRGTCTLACNGGGWCNWGRGGDGRCTCWSNTWQNSYTWNPLDNVCIGTKRFGGDSIYNSNTRKEFIEANANSDGPPGEYCPSYGWCNDRDTGKDTSQLCGYETWGGDNKNLNDQTQENNWDVSQDWSGKIQNPDCNNCVPWHPINFLPSNTKMQTTCNPS